ncbi:hypothetical protein HBB16_12420 [Pseudonocardia sp. MCCB 268]|nr:hypothetical protein [Pseudonocardia cytotoxica]
MPNWPRCSPHYASWASTMFRSTGPRSPARVCIAGGCRTARRAGRWPRPETVAAIVTSIVPRR